MTHIIISIADIEKSISLWEEQIKECREGEYSWAESIALSRLAFYKSVLQAQFKQISLDEKEIEKKAEFHSNSLPSDFSSYTYENGVIVGYKQAIKDLL